MKIDQRWYVQIFSIVLMFLIFWPVAVYFLICRSQSAKQGKIFEGLDKKQCTVYAAFFAVIAVVILFEKDVRPFFIVYAAGGGAMYYYGIKNEKHIERCKKYIDMNAVNGITDLNVVSAEINIPYELCRNEVSALISKGIFGNASINDSQRIIVYRKVENVDIQNAVTVYCSCCGARYTAIKGINYKCEYCGNIIQG